MKSIQIKNRFRYMILMFSCVMLAAGFMACSDDDIDEPADLYADLHIRGNDEAGNPADLPLEDGYLLELGNGESSSYHYSVKTNMQSWTVSSKGEGDLSWLRIWPGTGEGDGRFYIKLSKNYGFTERNAQIVITASNGKEIHLFDVKQNEGKRVLDASGIKEINSQATHMAIKVTTNAEGWIVSGYDEGVTIESVDNDRENGLVVYSVPANDAPDAKDRKFNIYLSTTDSPVLQTTFTLTQKKPE